MTPAERDNLAAGMALGTLTQDERAEADRLAARDADFRAEVLGWELSLAPLAEAMPPVPPPDRVWSAIERALPAGPAVAAEPSKLAASLERMRHQLAIWRMGAVAAGLAAVILAALLLGNSGSSVSPPTAEERYVAMLNSDRGDMGFLITVDASAREFQIRTMAEEPPDSKAYELWLLQDDGSVPLTLGIIERGPFVTLTMAPKLADMDWSRGTELAVSLESLEGAPSGLAMGPVVYAGTVFRQTR